jgi:hypothetical protein
MKSVGVTIRTSQPAISCTWAVAHDSRQPHGGCAASCPKETVALEARSKRGVARAEVSFDTNAGSYLASGGADEFHGTGTICSLAQPFTIEGSGVTMSFTPSSDKGGTCTYRGSMQGFEVSGKGTYTVTANDKGGTITATGEGSVKTPMGTMTANGTETYTLTPTDTCR